MHTTHQLKLLRAGFTLYTGEKHHASGLVIKIKTINDSNWHTFESGFGTKAALKRRLSELDKLPKWIDLRDSKNSSFN